MATRDISSTSSSSLDSKKINRNRWCGRWSVHGPVPEEQININLCARLPCKQWNCETCGPRRRRYLRYAIIDAAQQKDLRRFLTLTLNPSLCAAKDSLTYLRRCWNKFRTYLRRYAKANISFIAIPEFQKSGYAHLHILISHFLSQAWVSQAWQAVGGGKIVDISAVVDIHRIAPYLGKYLTKDSFSIGYKKGERRYTTSRDIMLNGGRSHSTGWRVSKVCIEGLRLYLRKCVIEEQYSEMGALKAFLYDATQAALWDRTAPHMAAS